MGFSGIRFIFLGVFNGWPVLVAPCAAAVAGDARQTQARFSNPPKIVMVLGTKNCDEKTRKFMVEQCQTSNCDETFVEKNGGLADKNGDVTYNMVS